VCVCVWGCLLFVGVWCLEVWFPTAVSWSGFMVCVGVVCNKCECVCVCVCVCMCVCVSERVDVHPNFWCTAVDILVHKKYRWKYWKTSKLSGEFKNGVIFCYLPAFKSWSSLNTLPIFLCQCFLHLFFVFFCGWHEKIKSTTDLSCCDVISTDIWDTIKHKILNLSVDFYYILNGETLLTSERPETWNWKCQVQTKDEFLIAVETSWHQGPSSSRTLVVEKTPITGFYTRAFTLSVSILDGNLFLTFQSDVSRMTLALPPDKKQSRACQLMDLTKKLWKNPIYRKKAAEAMKKLSHALNAVIATKDWPSGIWRRKKNTWTAPNLLGVTA